MGANNSGPTRGGELAMDDGGWRSQFLPDCRQRIVNKIMETLERHLPVSGQEGLHELRKIVVRFEEKIYTSATSQLDYLKKISLKILLMEAKSQNSMGSSSPFISLVPSNHAPDSAKDGMQSDQAHSVSDPSSASQLLSGEQVPSRNMLDYIADFLDRP